MSDKRYIPKPKIYEKSDNDSFHEDITKYNFCNCKIPSMNCSWPECICDCCLNFRENCECLKDDEQNK